MWILRRTNKPRQQLQVTSGVPSAACKRTPYTNLNSQHNAASVARGGRTPFAFHKDTRSRKKPWFRVVLHLTI